MSRRLLALLLTAAVAALIGMSGCGDDDDDASDTGAQTQPTETQTQTQTQTTPPVNEVKPVKATKVTPSAGEANPNRKPKVPEGDGDPPSRLVAQDLIAGKGTRAKAGDMVSVHYVGVLFDNGKQFDSNWETRTEPGQPFRFTIGGGQVIEGWERGLIGMREGGRRKLIIPPRLAYGAQGYPPDIPANAALIFDIDLDQVGL